jgi:hypothetical protein
MRVSRSLGLALCLFAPVAPVSVGALGCSGSNVATTPTTADAADANPTSDAADETTPGDPCPPCVDDSSCGGGFCVQLGVDSYCAPSCSTAACAADRACLDADDTSGTKVRACVPRGDVCGAPVGPGGQDSGVADTLVADAIGDTGSTTADAGTPTGSVSQAGGKVSRLVFAAAGDTRPAIIGDTKNYPSATIQKIYTRIAGLTPQPQFAVSTGDYMFAIPGTTQGASQLDLYLAARAKFPGVLFPALGNHECTGATTSNCPPPSTNTNYGAFTSKLLAPIGRTLPWYSFRVDAIDGSWTAKFVMVAPNAWNAEQASWLSTTMKEPTTYTFVVRHEPAAANTAPGTTPSQTILDANPYTLLIVGHTHTYARKSTREVIFGNGGAPITGTAHFGFGLFTMRADHAIQVDMIDADTGAPDLAFRFAVKADGSAAP